MAKVTSKLQVTIPKRIADQFAIVPGDDIEFVAAGDGIRIVPASRRATAGLGVAERLRLFDAATARQRARDKGMKPARRSAGDRGWTRDELHARGKPR